MPADLSPADEDLVARVRAELGFDLPAECLPGVRANLGLLAEHVRQLEGKSE
jgi:hypothetical protein